MITRLSLFLFLSILDCALSCGGLFCAPQQPVLQAGETIAFGISSNHHGGRDVVMIIQINYEGPAEEFSWILPVMYEPNLSVGSDVMFSALFEQTRPTFNLNINNDMSTCTDEALEGQCFAREVAFPASAQLDDEDAAEVVNTGNIGPYEYVVLRPSETEPGESVFNWLEENGYDQPEESLGLIDYYARQDHLFLALRLQKESIAGDIVPIILEYAMPGDMLNVACVPIQLTSIAATPDMPIQVYLFSDVQAFPVNYFSVELDDAQADWVGCFGSPNCYLNDMRSRLSAFLEEEGISGHAFLTEYAGSSEIVYDAVALNVDLPALMNAQNATEYLRLLEEANVPDVPIVQTILEQFIPKQYMAGSPPLCADGNIYQPQPSTPSPVRMIRCSNFLVQEPLNAAALTQELQTKVFEPSVEAQNWVSSYPYLTRFYGQLSPENMDKDPFFAFNNMLPDVSNVHEAEGVPYCGDNGQISGLNITVGDTSFQQPATLVCQQWRRTDSEPLFGPNSPSTASSVSAFGYVGQESRILERSESGNFSPEIVREIVAFMDSRVPSQIVPPYVNRTVTNIVPDISTSDATSATDNTGETVDEINETDEETESVTDEVDATDEIDETSEAVEPVELVEPVETVETVEVTGPDEIDESDETDESDEIDESDGLDQSETDGTDETDETDGDAETDADDESTSSGSLISMRDLMVFNVVITAAISARTLYS